MVKIIDYKQTHDVDNKEQGIQIFGFCLSTDEKPTEYANGSMLVETDHEDGIKCYIFSEDTKKWIAQN